MRVNESALSHTAWNNQTCMPRPTSTISQIGEPLLSLCLRPLLMESKSDQRLWVIMSHEWLIDQSVLVLWVVGIRQNLINTGATIEIKRFWVRAHSWRWLRTGMKIDRDTVETKHTKMLKCLLVRRALRTRLLTWVPTRANLCDLPSTFVVTTTRWTVDYLMSRGKPTKWIVQFVVHSNQIFTLRNEGNCKISVAIVPSESQRSSSPLNPKLPNSYAAASNWKDTKIGRKTIVRGLHSGWSLRSKIASDRSTMSARENCSESLKVW